MSATFTLLPGLESLGDRYEFLEELNVGPLANVYRARDLRHDRHVVVKVLRPEVARGLGPGRFLQEVQSSARLRHAHIIPVYDSGDAEGLPYYVMPFIAGGTLRQRLEREGQLPFDEVVRIATGMALGLAHAHEHGIVHRDVKPENVLLDGPGVLIADFGIARSVEARSSTSTTTGLAVGTPGYMSPEQAVGARSIDGRADQYALACVIYEMLTGEQPFSGASPQAVLARQVHETPPSAHVVRPSVPEPADRVLRRALAKAPVDRYPSITSFSSAVASSLQEDAGSIAAAPARPFLRASQWRRVAWSAGGVAAIVVLYLGLSGSRHRVDAQRVAVFPLVDRAASSEQSHDAAEVPVYLGYVLEGTDPLRWDDGTNWLPAGPSATMTNAATLRRVAERHGVGFAVDGQVIRRVDSTTVVLRLHDIRGDSIVAQRGQTAAAGVPVAQIAARTLAGLLPLIVTPDRPVDVAQLGSRAPATVANFLQGERAYRAGRFQDAITSFGRAAQDTMFPLALLRSAEAEAWFCHCGTADSLVDLALARVELLPPRYRTFARAFSASSKGLADSALREASRAIAADSGWAEAWSLLGEVYYHLIPDVDRPDSLATVALATAHRLAPDLSGPTYHLAEIALRRGDAAVARRLADSLALLGADSTLEAPLALMLRCAERDGLNWTTEARDHPRDVLEAAKTLSTGLPLAACAESGFAGIIATDSAASPAQRFAAAQGALGLALRRGDSARAAAIIEDERVQAVRGHYLAVLADAAGLGLHSQALLVVDSLDRDVAPASNTVTWLLALWHAHRGRPPRADSLARLLRERADSGNQPLTRLFADEATAHALLGQGDTAAALDHLQRMTISAPKSGIAWTLWDSRGFDRLTQARIAMALRRPADALVALRAFDSPQPVTYLLFVRPALQLRLEAAEAMGNRNLTALTTRQLKELDGAQGRQVAANHPGR